MKERVRLFTLLIVIAALSFAAPLFAQDQEVAPPVTDAKEDTPAEGAKPSSSQEVEINEDTYRQFMELKDANRQGDIIPETAFKPGSGLQKLDKLPEESQKHLRNELREIIVDGDPWQPGDENADYPYTPSEAASKNPALQKQEMEAWGELVDSYNQREAQIYADRAGSRAAMSSEQAGGFKPGGGANEEGDDGEGNEGAAGRPSEQDGNPDNQDTAGGFSPDAVHDPNAQNTAGVSQNALEFLQGLGGDGENAAGQETGTTRDGGGQARSQAADASQAQAQAGQQAATDNNAAAEVQSAASNTETGTAGASQNAMEFLSRAGARAGNAGESRSGSSSPQSGHGKSGESATAEVSTKGEQAGQDTGQLTAQSGSQGQTGESASSRTSADGQQAGQDSGQSMAQNSGERSAEGEEPGEQGEGQSGPKGEASAQVGQQTETAEKTWTSPPVPEGDITFSSSASGEESTVGTSQNAMEYLKGENSQPGVPLEGTMDTDSPPKGTLNIQDLLNAQGVGGAAATDNSNHAPDAEKDSGGSKTGKDGGEWQ